MSTDEQFEWVAAYQRVSSDEQREKESIKTQTDAIDSFLANHPEMRLFKRYLDDGVTGTLPLRERPAGAELLADAASRCFSKALVTRPNRIGRKAVHILNGVEELENHGVTVVGIVDPMDDKFILGIKAVVAEEERRSFLENSAMGMARAVREGRFPGGIVGLGYKVEGRQHTARLAISSEPMWRNWTESDVARQIFEWSASERWSCRGIADHLNSLGVPTAYQVAGRCVRKKRTRGEWTPGRIRQILTTTTYKGIYEYGKRNKNRTLIKAPCEAIVSEALWDEAQRTLALHNLRPTTARHVFLLKSVVKCGICGLTFSGTVGRGVVWYRCNGQIAWRGKLKGKCYAKSIDGRVVEPLIWSDVERWLLEPGHLLEELAAEQNAGGAAAVAETERTLVGKALADIAEQRNRMLDVYRRGRISVDEFETQMDEIAEEQKRLEQRERELRPAAEPEEEFTATRLREAIRSKMHEGLTPSERQEIVRLLVKRVRIATELVDGKKIATLVVEYRFPAVNMTDTGRGSSRRRA